MSDHHCLAFSNALHNALIRILGEKVGRLRIPVGGDDAGDPEKQGPQADKESDHKAQAPGLQKHSGIGEQVADAGGLTVDDAERIPREAQLQKSDDKGSDDGDQKSGKEHADHQYSRGIAAQKAADQAGKAGKGGDDRLYREQDHHVNKCDEYRMRIRHSHGVFGIGFQLNTIHYVNSSCNNEITGKRGRGGKASGVRFPFRPYCIIKVAQLPWKL